MRSLRLRAALAATAAAVFTVATFSATTADAAPAPGTLTVALVDEHGGPMPGMTYVISGQGVASDSQQGTASHAFTLPAGAYAIVAITPWGGLQCAGLDVCDFAAVSGGTALPDGELAVRAGQDTPVTITGAPPASVTGPGRIGAPLTMTFSPGMSNLLDYMGRVGAALAPTVTWLRNGVPIGGGTNLTAYTPVAADAGTSVSARLEYTGLALTEFQMIAGGTLTPRTTNAIRVGKVATRTFTILSKPQIGAGDRGRARVEVTGQNVIVTGKVLMSLGDWSQTRTLRNGRARFVLPQLKPGTYSVVARYVGNTTYQPSTGQQRTLTVTR